MIKDIVVSVCGVQGLTEGKDQTEMITTGSFHEKNGKLYIQYEEETEISGQTIKNRIKIEPDRIEVMKSGIITSHMVFERGRKNSSLYSTPFGRMEVGIFGTDILVEKQEDRIEVRLDYMLDLNNEYVANSQIHIIVTPQPAAQTKQ